MRDNLGNPMFSALPRFARGVLLIEECEQQLLWVGSGTGGDDIHAFAAAAAYYGAQGLHLKTRTTSSAANDITTASRQIGYPESGLLVMRALVAEPSPSRNKSISMGMLVCDGITETDYRMTISTQTPSVGILNAAGTITAVAALLRKPVDATWTMLELAVNLHAGVYWGASWCGARADLPAIGGYVGAPPSAYMVRPYFSAVAVGANPAELYADNIYVGEYVDI